MRPACAQCVRSPATGWPRETARRRGGQDRRFRGRRSDLGARYAVLEKSRLPVSRKVLVAIEWIEEVSWVDQQVRVDIPVAQIEGAPELDPRTPVNEELESVLYDFYGRPRGRADDHRP